jgi:hypothetical protein
MYGQWLRVSPDELTRAKADIEWATKFAREVVNRAAEDDLAQRRAFGTDKAWHALAYLLERRDFPVNIVFGEQPLTADDDSADWGYGPPRYLTPAQVNLAAAELVALTVDEFVGGVALAELAREQIYPNVWDDPEELTWVAAHLAGVRTWFSAAAAAGDAVLCWIG